MSLDNERDTTVGLQEEGRQRSRFRRSRSGTAHGVETFDVLSGGGE